MKARILNFPSTAEHVDDGEDDDEEDEAEEEEDDKEEDTDEDEDEEEEEDEDEEEEDEEEDEDEDAAGGRAMNGVMATTIAACDYYDHEVRRLPVPVPLLPPRQ